MNFLILKFFGLFLICLIFFNSFHVANSNEINKLKSDFNKILSKHKFIISKISELKKIDCIDRVNDEKKRYLENKNKLWFSGSIDAYPHWRNPKKCDIINNGNLIIYDFFSDMHTDEWSFHSYGERKFDKSKGKIYGSIIPINFPFEDLYYSVKYNLYDANNFNVNEDGNCSIIKNLNNELTLDCKNIRTSFFYRFETVSVFKKIFNLRKDFSIKEIKIEFDTHENKPYFWTFFPYEVKSSFYENKYKKYKTEINALVNDLHVLYWNWITPDHVIFKTHENHLKVFMTFDNSTKKKT